MDGRAVAPAAGTVLNALATGYGAAFAIDRYVTATVTLGGDSVTGSVEGDPDADTALIEQSVERVFEAFDVEDGATVRTEAEFPMASGLKSSSAAANATVLATLDAIDQADAVTLETAARYGVDAARRAGVTVTGAFDDASASMLGGLTITHNEEDTLLLRDAVDWEVAVWIPPEQAFSADADVDACKQIAPMAELVRELALAGRYAMAMTVNGFAFSAALDRPTDPMLEALPDVAGVSLSGTGPSYVAVGEAPAIDALIGRWDEREGRTIRTTTQTTGARIE